MKKFRKVFCFAKGCPNGCGASFKIDFKNRPKGMAEHLEHCGGAFPLPEKSMRVLRSLKTRGDVDNGRRALEGHRNL